MIDADEAIAGRLRRREPGAFDEFFERFASRLLGYLESMVRDRATAEDLLQETMLRVHRAIDRYEERGVFRAWVFRTATNVAISELRRRRAARSEPLDRHAEVLPCATSDPARAHDAAWRARAVATALAGLDEDHRVVVLLRWREEMSVAEIAGSLGIPQGTVKSRMHHAVRRLRASIDGSGVPSRTKEKP